MIELFRDYRGITNVVRSREGAQGLLAQLVREGWLIEEIQAQAEEALANGHALEWLTNARNQSKYLSEVMLHMRDVSHYE